MVTIRREVSKGRTYDEKASYKEATRLTLDEDYQFVKVEPYVSSATYTAPADTKTKTSQTNQGTIRIKSRLEGEEIMPTVVSDSYQEAAVETPQRREKLDSKVKSLIITYIIAAIVLAAVVIGTGIAVSGIGGEVNSLQGRVSEMNISLTQQQTVLELLSDEDVIKAQAAQLEMKKVSNINSVEQLNVVDTVTYEEKVNAFDRICDLISRFFGN